MRRYPYLALLVSISFACLTRTADVFTESKKTEPIDRPLTLRLPVEQGSVRFAIIGDSGTGGAEQYQIAKLMVEYRKIFPFEFVLMMGDNLYGGESPKDYNKKFEAAYRPLLDAGVKFYASLGNHDNPNQRFYRNFGMEGERYYTFKPGGESIRFFALDSNYMDPAQLKWLERELSSSQSKWKICFFHHPIYSSGGRHGSDMELREVLEPLFLKHGVKVVLCGHEHFYERIKPQKGIYHFISGAAAKLRKGDIEKSELTAKGFDRDRHFMLIEIAGDNLYFQTISRTGQTVDSGIITLEKKNNKKAAASEVTVFVAIRAA